MTDVNATGRDGSILKEVEGLQAMVQAAKGFDPKIEQQTQNFIATDTTPQKSLLKPPATKQLDEGTEEVQSPKRANNARFGVTFEPSSERLDLIVDGALSQQER